ncbi:MAG: DUF5119 domain-containing protein, partial [Rikenellaceae bacterium]
MKSIIKYIVAATASLSALVSCDFDHLHYETYYYALIHIQVDWQTLSHVSPNGASAYVFDSNGDRYSDVVLSSDANNIYLKLPQGDYSVVIHNNSISELSGVELIGSDHFDTFSIHATNSSADSEFDVLEGENFVNEPDDVVSYTIHDLHVDADDVKYHYDKPDLSDYEQEVSQTYLVQPDHIVHVTRIIAYFDNVEYSSSKSPMAVLHGMSGGYYFAAECTSEEDVMEEFEANVITNASTYLATRVSGALDILDPDDSYGYTNEELEGMGLILVDCNTFGMHITDPE